jgi:hypothetical protein
MKIDIKDSKKLFSSVQERDKTLLDEAIRNLALVSAYLGKTVEVKFKDIANYGNAIVPQVALELFKVIQEIDNQLI